MSIPSRGDLTSSPRLLRVVGHWDLTAQGVNIVLASSIFVLPGITLLELAAWAPVAVAAAAVGNLFILLSFAEAAGRYDRPGGPYRYSADAFGEYVGVQIGLLYWVVRATATASVANVFVLYLAQLWPPAAEPFWRMSCLTLAVLGGGWLNFRGTRQAASVLNLVAIAKALPLVVLCSVGAFSLSAGAFTSESLPGSSAWARAILLWIFAFGGFEATVTAASEARDPVRDMPRALLKALAIVAVFYVAVQIVVVGILPPRPTPRPVGEVAQILLGNWGALAIAMAAIIATNGHIAGSILASSRITYAIADARGLPALLARVHPRFRTPHVSIALFTVAVWLLAVSGSFIWNASISAVGRLLVYVATAVAVLRLRRSLPSAFIVPTWVHVVTAGFCIWLLLHQTLAEAIAVSIVLAGGSVIWIGYRGWRRPPPLAAQDQQTFDSQDS
jgi:amino acid transporter